MLAKHPAAAWTCFRIRRAMARDELALYLQPQVSLINGRVEAVEALVRWEDHHHGLIFPGAFIGAVQHSPMARKFDSWAIRAAVREAAALRDAGYPLRVSVNVAPCSLADHRLPTEVAWLLDQAGLAPDALEIEVTEQAFDAANGQAARTMHELASLGVSTALDDFGVGFSSLTRVAAFPFATLKIDRSLVTHIDRCTRAGIVFSAAVRLAHELGLGVVAEGVETLRTWARSENLGADRAQGWLIAQALPRGELLARLRAGALAGPGSPESQELGEIAA